MSEIKDLKFDDKNFNKHTEFGMSLLEKSLQDHGAGRSILLDKNNNIIAGNGIVEAAENVGLDNVQIVESDGKKLIAVKRTDIDLNSKAGREMALADNATNSVDLAWDFENLEDVFDDNELAKWGINLDGWKADSNLDDFFTERENQNQKEPKKVKCPNCGKEFEID